MIRATAPAKTPLGTLILRIYLPFAGAYFLSYLYRAVNSVVGPVIADEFALAPDQLGFLTSAYFIMFAAVQLPLGVALDRFGPRRVQTVLMLFAAAGAVVFGLGQSLAMLTFGRALIGLGMAAGLMAALKVITLWFSPERWPLMNGLHMTAGGLGALVATWPTKAALTYTSWHGLFFGLSGVTLASALLIWRCVPERPGSQAPGTLREQFAAVLPILRDPYFWRLVPVFTTLQCGFIGIQTLWIGPWLRDVGAQSPDRAAFTMLLTTLGMMAGFFVSGMVAVAMARRGVSHVATATCGGLLFTGNLALIIFVPALPPEPLWMLFGFFGTFAILYFPPLQQAFPPELSGRVTTCINFVTFAAVYFAQGGMGSILRLWPYTPSHYDPQGYIAAFGLFIGLELASIAWLLLFRPRPLTQRASPTVT